MNKQTETRSYEIRLQEDLSNNWQLFFSGLEFQRTEQAGHFQTRLIGELDQSALHGVLNQIRDLNLHLVSLSIIPSVPTNVTPQKGICL